MRIHIRIAARGGVIVLLRENLAVACRAIHDLHKTIGAKREALIALPQRNTSAFGIKCGSLPPELRILPASPNPPAEKAGTLAKRIQSLLG